jgi:hypothetical protein
MLTSNQYNYDDMAALTTNTAGSLKKMWPPVKKKAIEKYASFGAFLGAPSAPAGGEPKSAAPKVNNGKKRKAADENPEDGTKDLDPTSAASIKSDSNKADSKKKTTAKGGNRNKKAKKEKADSEAEKAEDSADGGDGLGEYTFSKHVLQWLDNADGE